MRRHVCRGALAVLAILGLWLGAALEASQVRPLNLEQMTERAAAIFTGRCVGLSTATDPGLKTEVTIATFQVTRSVKGSEHGIITVRMPAGSAVSSGVGGLPSFHEGDEVVLFLYGKSRLGLRVPVGLGQGSFRVVKDKRGRATALNDLGNRHLLRGLSAPAQNRLATRFDLGKPAEGMTPAELLGMAEAILAGSGETPRAGGRP